jgi:hypothetical protein
MPTHDRISWAAGLLLKFEHSCRIGETLIIYREQSFREQQSNHHA